MTLDADKVATGAWILFLASWWTSALWVAKASKKAPFGRRTLYMAGFTLGFASLFGFGIYPSGVNAPLWQAPAVVEWALFAAQIGAFAFAWWARLHLGRLWSGMLTLREGHRVVDSGPYAQVRHPIYTGFIAAAWAFALIGAHPLQLFGASVLTLVMVIKSGEEERFLRQELGPAEYDAYAARIPKLIPGWTWRTRK